MYKVVFYKDKKGDMPVKDYIDSLEIKNNKTARINLNKILEIIRILKIKGLNTGMPYIRYLKDGIWEMRPKRNRILFFSYQNSKFILLHVFQKKTRKTPIEEIEKAKIERSIYMEGEINYEEKSI